MITYPFNLEIIQENHRYGCRLTTRYGAQTICETAVNYPTQNDAVYAALHHFATLNNFTDCLNHNPQLHTQPKAA